MTPREWLEHAARCREVAATMDDAAARRVLLEAADDYQALAGRNPGAWDHATSYRPAATVAHVRHAQL